MKTRAYLFTLVNVQIVDNANGLRGQRWVLELFREFKPYAWGPACLANLYRLLARVITLIMEDDLNSMDVDIDVDMDVDINKGKKNIEKKVTLVHTLSGPVQVLQVIKRRYLSLFLYCFITY